MKIFLNLDFCGANTSSNLTLDLVVCSLRVQQSEYKSNVYWQPRFHVVAFQAVESLLLYHVITVQTVLLTILCHGRSESGWNEAQLLDSLWRQNDHGETSCGFPVINLEFRYSFFTTIHILRNVIFCPNFIFSVVLFWSNKTYLTLSVFFFFISFSLLWCMNV